MNKIIIDDTHLVIGDVIGGINSLYYNFPSFELTSNREWIVCAREITSLVDPKGRIRVRKSSDRGKTWREMLSPTCHDEIDHPQNGFLMCHITEIMPGVLLAVYLMIYTDDEKPLFDADHDGMQRADVRIAKSFDNGINWNKPKDMDYRSRDLIIPSKAIKLPDGSIGIPCEMHNNWGEGYAEGLAAKIVKSYDGGNTFSKEINIAVSEKMLYGDARPMLADDKLIMYFWTYNTKEQKDMNVHLSSSDDSGESWSKAMPINLNMQITSPAYIDDELMLCVCQDRFSDRPGIKAMLSHNGGMDWDTKTEVTVFGTKSVPSGKNPFSEFSQFKFGYSSITKISEREFAVSYWHNNQATTSVSVAVLRVEQAEF